MKRGVTKRQKELLQIIYNSLNSNGYPPSFSEFREQLNIKSNQAIIDHLESLAKKGYISRSEHSARAIRITPLGYKIINSQPLIPLEGVSYAGFAGASFQIEGQWQKVSGEVKINQEVFVIQVSGDSMINAGINSGDFLLAQPSSQFINGDIVLAKNKDGTTIKRFISQDRPPYLYLKPENPKYDIILFTPEVEMQAKIIGKWIEGKIKTLTQGRFI